MLKFKLSTLGSINLRCIKIVEFRQLVVAYRYTVKDCIQLIGKQQSFVLVETCLADLRSYQYVFVGYFISSAVLHLIVVGRQNLDRHAIGDNLFTPYVYSGARNGIFSRFLRHKDIGESNLMRTAHLSIYIA